MRTAAAPASGAGAETDQGSAARVWQASQLEARRRRRRAYDAVARKGRVPTGAVHEELVRVHRALVPEGGSVLEIGCGTGELLAALRPSAGVGLDASRAMVERARALHPDCAFVCGDVEALPLGAGRTFDTVVMSRVLGDLLDIWRALREVRPVLRPDSRLILTWPRFAARGTRPPETRLSPGDVANLLRLCGFEVVRASRRVLLPIGVPLLAPLCSRLLAKIPGLRSPCLLHVVVARPLEQPPSPPRPLRCSVVVPTRNEAGNVDAAVARIPEMGAGTEIVFVDGASTDGTVERIEAQIRAHAGRRTIRLVHQLGRPASPADPTGAGDSMLPAGKGDAVRQGFEVATGDVLMILDGDLTVPPEDLPKFFAAISEGRGELANGTRLVYPLEAGSMRLLNELANRIFGRVLSALLEQRTADTLCGTKALLRRDYERIAAGREAFGDFDPFGDFDLLFGAARLHLRIVDVPIRYQARSYGEIKIRRWRHGWLLLRMTWLALRKL